jgi:hypothetical protein
VQLVLLELMAQLDLLDRKVQQALWEPLALQEQMVQLVPLDRLVPVVLQVLQQRLVIHTAQPQDKQHLAVLI